MPRKAKPPRLHLRHRKDRGKYWVILDRGHEYGTGCSADDVAGAEKALQAHIIAKHQPTTRQDRLELIPIADVINRYLTEHAAHSASGEWIAHMLGPVLEWWGAKTLADVRGGSCREFVAWRTAQGVSTHTAASNLSEMRAAIRHYHQEHGPLSSVPAVTLPPKSQPRTDYWLTRKQVADRIRAARRRKYCQHIIRVLLIGVYTGTRPGTARKLRWIPSVDGGWFDLDTETLHRLPDGAVESNKRARPARIHRRLLPHLRRWRDADMANGITHCIHYRGQPVAKLRRSWRGVALDAGHTKPDGAHICRHTAATWQMQSGVDLAQAAGYLSMDPRTMWDRYGHHHPDFQDASASADGKRPALRIVDCFLDAKSEANH